MQHPSHFHSSEIPNASSPLRRLTGSTAALVAVGCVITNPVLSVFAVDEEPSDTTAPIAVFTHPPADAITNSLETIAGTVADEEGGSGVAGVQINLIRLSDGFSWDGDGWGLDRFYHQADLTGGNWIYRFGPKIDQLSEIAYQLNVLARDNAGNEGAARITVTIDKTPPPTLTLLHPASGSTNLEIAAIDGTVADTAGGSGMATVTVQMAWSDSGIELFWDGTQWNTVATDLSANLAGDGWSLAAALPTGVDLIAGPYSLTLQATDRAGNRATLRESFFIKEPENPEQYRARITTMPRVTSGNYVEWEFTGQPGRNYRVQASTNLVQWDDVGAVTLGVEGKTFFADGDWANYRHRFYRVVTP